jgi:hypothetical protein
MNAPAITAAKAEATGMLLFRKNQNIAARSPNQRELYVNTRRPVVSM